jgi:hypothetical protein
LAAAIEVVRAELQRAAEAGAGSSLRFIPGPVELDFEVAFSTMAEAEGGVKVWVLAGGAKGQASRGRTQRLKVTLNPLDMSTGEPPQISDTGRE